jgi:hypothetical protein
VGRCRCIRIDDDDDDDDDDGGGGGGSSSSDGDDGDDGDDDDDAGYSMGESRLVVVLLLVPLKYSLCRAGRRRGNMHPKSTSKRRRNSHFGEISSARDNPTP